MFAKVLTDARLHVSPLASASVTMSAYGTIAAPTSGSSQPLIPVLYRLPDESKNLAVVPLKKASVPEELAAHLHEVRQSFQYPSTCLTTLPSCSMALSEKEEHIHKKPSFLCRSLRSARLTRHEVVSLITSHRTTF